MANLLTVLFIFGGVLLLWLNARDWYSSQVIISGDEYAAVADRPAPLRRPIARSARPQPPGTARVLLTRLYRLAS